MSHDARLSKLLAEKMKRQKREARLDFDELCFPSQKRFVASESKYSIACCSRRAGKTFGVAIKLLKTAFAHPKTLSLYVTMSRTMGKDILWPALEWLNDEYDLGLEFKMNTGDVVLPNKSKILMRGAGSKREVDKMRGPKYVGVCVDEAQGFNWLLEYMIDEVIEPATLDYGDDAWIAITGTPNAMCSGPFFDMWHGIAGDRAKDQRKQVWEPHHWTFFDNVWQPNPEKQAGVIRERRGWTEETPRYVREYRGLWVKDTEGAAWHIPDHAIVYSVPWDSADDWRYTLGVDLGINDPCAFVMFAWSRYLGECYIIESFESEVDSPSGSAAEVGRLLDRYGAISIIADTGGQGKAHVGEWAETYGIPAEPANKHDKGGRVSIINDAFKAGTLKIVQPKNHNLITQASIIQWDEDARERGRWVYERGYLDHLCDALQYGYQGCYHTNPNFRRQRDVDPSEYYKNLEERMERAQSHRVRSRSKPGWKRHRERYYRPKAQ